MFSSNILFSVCISDMVVACAVVHPCLNFAFIMIRYEFDYLITETDFARGLSQADFLAFYDGCIMGGPSASARKLLGVWVTPPPTSPDEVATPSDATVLGPDADLTAFKARLPLYRRTPAAAV